MLPFVRLSDYKALAHPSGPLFSYIFPWSIVLIGQILALCRIIVPTYSMFYLLIIGNMLSIAGLAIFLQTYFPQDLQRDLISARKITISFRFKYLIYGLLALYFCLECIQVVVFRGFPLLWLLIGNGKTYFDYGASSLNGLLNAIYLFATTSLFIFYMKERGMGKALVLCVLFTIPILLVSRQLLVNICIQVACVILIYKPKQAIRIGLYGCILLFVFILIGNYRTGMKELVRILDPEPFIPEFLHPLLWIYAYIVTPFNNLNSSFDSIIPLGAPVNEFAQLLPSMIRNFFGFTTDSDGYVLVHKNMTVSTFYLDPMLDFGALYAFSMMVIFQFFLILAFRRALKEKSAVYIVEYTVLYSICFLSIFANHLIYLPVIFQLVIINLFKISFFRERGIALFSFSKARLESG